MIDKSSTMQVSAELTTTKPQSASGKIFIAVLFAAAISAFFYFDLKQYLSLDALKSNRDSLLAFTLSCQCSWIRLQLLQSPHATPMSRPIKRGPA